jgi:hypothetical protein
MADGGGAPRKRGPRRQSPALDDVRCHRTALASGPSAGVSNGTGRRRSKAAGAPSSKIRTRALTFFCGSAQGASTFRGSDPPEEERAEDISRSLVHWSHRGPGLANYRATASRRKRSQQPGRTSLSLRSPKRPQGRTNLLEDSTVLTHALQKERSWTGSMLALGGTRKRRRAFGAHDFESLAHERALRQLNLGIPRGLNAQMRRRSGCRPVRVAIMHAKLGRRGRGVRPG